jgi:hypothetical protein
MTFKRSDLTRKGLEKLISKHELKPALKSQNPYIAGGPNYEILASLKSNGLYEVQLLDRKQVEQSIQKTISLFREYTMAAKS